MFLDLGVNGPNGYWDEGPVCKSCKRMIDKSDPAETLSFDELNDQQFDGMNGLYHSDCARPYLSMMRALIALRRFSR